MTGPASTTPSSRSSRSSGESSTPNLDIEATLALILGPFMHRRLVDDAEIDDELSETTLKACVAGLRISGSG